MKTMKVFDCQEMPYDIRKTFFEWVNSDNGHGNDCLVNWNTQTWTEEAETVGDCGMNEELAKKFHIVNNWLLKNGMNPKEDVIIRHWW